MAIKLSFPSCAAARPGAPLPHHVQRPRLCLAAPNLSCVCGPARESRGAGSEERSLLVFSAFRKQSISRSRKAAAGKQASFRLLRCLQGDSVAEEPIENRRGPRLQWVLFAAGVVAVGLLIFLRLKGGALTTVEAGEAATLQPTSAFLKTSPASDAGFNVKLPGLGYVSLGYVTPGWVYFLLLMAAGFGLFVSEEALNVWVGASLGRLLSYGSREAFSSSLFANSPYILSTVLWVYWGVCISDMVPFYAGKLASRSSDRLCQKLGVSKEKYEQLMATVQRYGNLIGFVERFSIGARNPTALLAGVAGISPAKFFAGVCLGGLFTLPIQMTIGFILRENPVAALAGVAAFVGGWTVFPYAAAAMVSLFYFVGHYIEKLS